MYPDLNPGKVGLTLALRPVLILNPGEKKLTVGMCNVYKVLGRVADKARMD